MPNARQKREIKRLMKRIKDARDNGRSTEVIKRRALDLRIYLEREGLKQSPDE